MHFCIPFVSQVPMEAQRRHQGSLELELTVVNCNVGARNHTGKKQPVLLTTEPEPSLQALFKTNWELTLLWRLALPWLP